MPPMGPDDLGRLYRELAPALRLYARQWRGDGDDLVQEAFVKLAQQSPPPTQLRAWLYRVVRNEALSAGRSDSRRRLREARTASTETWFASTDDRLDAAEATQLLTHLPLEQREVIVARIWGGLRFEEIAQLVDGALATVHRRYYAGLTSLRERLEGQWTRIPTT